MNDHHLKEAKFYAKSADGLNISRELVQTYAQLAIAHVLISIREQMSKAAKDADLEKERLERWREYQAQRETGIAL